MTFFEKIINKRNVKTITKTDQNKLKGGNSNAGNSIIIVDTGEG